MALQHPEKIIGLGLAGVYGWQPRVPLHRLANLAAHLTVLPAWVQALLRKGPGVMRLALRIAIANPEAITEDLVEDALAGVEQEGQIRTFVTWLRTEMGPTTLRTNYADRLHEIAAPVLILHGLRDWMMPAAYAYRAHERFPNSVLHVFENGGHMVPREYPRRANRLIADFLEQLAP
jgi:pimeloyl-ACP methyl ester carboxylesterase